MIMLDTHVAIFLYEGKVGGISARTKRDMEGTQLSLSPAVLLEIEILHEIGRVKPTSNQIVRSLREQLNVSVADDSFASIVDHAWNLAFTRDPFDRLIVAHAMLLKVPLVTYDSHIHANYRHALH